MRVGDIYLKNTNSNFFCILMDSKKKVITSCSLKVTQYENKFNERIDLYKRGALLGKLFMNKAIKLGFKKFNIRVSSGINKIHKGFVKDFTRRKRIKIHYIQTSKTYPHNGCRPPKVRRKKVRTRLRRR